MVTLVMIFFTVYIILKIYISIMEIGYVKNARNSPAVVLSSNNYLKAADYKIKSQKIFIIETFIEYILFIFWIGYGFNILENILLFENIYIKSIAFVLSFILVNQIISLPIDAYKTFKLDTEYGFSNIGQKLFLKDLFKSIMLTIILGSVLIFAVSFIIHNSNNWWIWSFLFLFGIIILVNLIYPTIIAPMFNKFTPLEDGDLKNLIENLLSSSGLKSDGVFVMDASQRDNRLNAYFGGFGKSKRIVLFDTLIKKLRTEELISVLAHELGHYEHKDVFKNIAIMGTILFFMFFIFGNLPFGFYAQFGLIESPYAIISMFLLLSSAITFFILPIVGYFSRKNEYAADKFAGQKYGNFILASALIKLADENKSFPKSHPIFIFFYHTHPPLLKRLEALGKKFDQSDDEALRENLEGNK